MCRDPVAIAPGTDVMRQAPPTVRAKLTAQSTHWHEAEGGAMDAKYIGVDFHARQQTTCYLKTETGELVISELKHQDKEQVRAFYEQFPSPVVVGLEASGYSPGSKPCWSNLVAKYGSVTPPKSGGGLVGAKRTIGAMRNSFGT